MICSTRGGDLEAEGDSKIGRDSDVIGRGCSMAVLNRDSEKGLVAVFKFSQQSSDHSTHL